MAVVSLSLSLCLSEFVVGRTGYGGEGLGCFGVGWILYFIDRSLPCLGFGVFMGGGLPLWPKRLVRLAMGLISSLLKSSGVSKMEAVSFRWPGRVQISPGLAPFRCCEACPTLGRNIENRSPDESTGGGLVILAGK